MTQLRCPRCGAALAGEGVPCASCGPVAAEALAPSPWWRRFDLPFLAGVGLCVVGFGLSGLGVGTPGRVLEGLGVVVILVGWALSRRRA